MACDEQKQKKCKEAMAEWKARSQERRDRILQEVLETLRGNRDK